MSPRARFVYFIKPVGMVGPIKIGCSGVPEDRLSSLMTWSPYPLEIVVAVPGGYKLEKNIHECFADFHSHREWFRPGQRLIEAIDRLKAGEPVEQAINLKNRLGKITKGRCGGGSWSDITRQKMSVMMRVRHALIKIGVNNHYCAPPHVRKLMDVSESRVLNPEEARTINDFCIDPSPFEDECTASDRERQLRIQKFRQSRAPAPSTTTGEAA